MSNELMVFITALLSLATLIILGVTIKMIVDFIKTTREDAGPEENLKNCEEFRVWRETNDDKTA